MAASGAGIFGSCPDPRPSDRPMTDLSAWPELPWRSWEPTITTLHRWTQIVGKIRMALTPPLNHWWHVTLFVTARGLTTGAMPLPDGRSVQIDFDLVDHRLDIRASDARAAVIALEPRSVASFYAAVVDALRGLGSSVQIWSHPVETADTTPLDTDEIHGSYDTDHATAFARGLFTADRALQAFRSGFVGKASPVQFFWGSFDLAHARYSGRPAPRHPGGAPNCPTWVMEEAYSREEMAAGWWPASDPPGPAFYAYTYPEPAGFANAPVSPDATAYDRNLGEFILPWDAVRGLPDPDAAVASFLRSTYAAAADLGNWDRTRLEPAIRPTQPQREPWTLVSPDASRDSGPHAHGRRLSRGAASR
jgi:hypothetical protein